MLKDHWRRCLVAALFAPFVIPVGDALALPAFALREKAPCSMCHTNGSAPHLTRYGFMYRRAGYRNPANIGNGDSDKDSMTLTNHMAVGINFDYEYVTNKPVGADKASTTANQFDARELELWPLVGAFQGNIGAFSEIDLSPATASPSPTTPVAPSAGGASLTHMELVYVHGNSDLFVSLRGGLLAPQGYGASDQWLDEGNLPLMDKLTAQYNQDTLVAPVGANGMTQLGAEIGVSYKNQSYLTLGLYNGYDGSNGLATKTASSITPVLYSGNTGGARDFKVQADQFIGGSTAISAVFYRGSIALLDPSNTKLWRNAYSNWRLYLTRGLGDHLDILAGAGNGLFQYHNVAPDETKGRFTSPGAFFGINTYIPDVMTISARYDYFEYNRFQGKSQRAVGGTLMVGLPLENTLVNFHLNILRSDIDGLTKDFRTEWRLVF